MIVFINLLLRGNPFFHHFHKRTKHTFFASPLPPPKSVQIKRQYDDAFAEIIFIIFKFWRKHTLALATLPPAYILQVHSSPMIMMKKWIALTYTGRNFNNKQHGGWIMFCAATELCTHLCSQNSLSVNNKLLKPSLACLEAVSHFIHCGSSMGRQNTNTSA